MHPRPGNQLPPTGRLPRSRLRGTQLTLARTLNQQQAVAELPIAGISGEIVWAKDSQNKLPHPRRGFRIRSPSPAVRALPRVPIRGYISPATCAPQFEPHYTPEPRGWMPLSGTPLLTANLLAYGRRVAAKQSGSKLPHSKAFLLMNGLESSSPAGLGKEIEEIIHRLPKALG